MILQKDSMNWQFWHNFKKFSIKITKSCHQIHFLLFPSQFLARISPHSFLNWLKVSLAKISFLSKTQLTSSFFVSVDWFNGDGEYSHEELGDSARRNSSRNCDSYSNNWPIKLKFGEMDGRFDLTYL